MMFADHISMLPEFLLLCGMFVLLLAAEHHAENLFYRQQNSRSRGTVGNGCLL